MKACEARKITKESIEKLLPARLTGILKEVEEQANKGMCFVTVQHLDQWTEEKLVALGYSLSNTHTTLGSFKRISWE